jgi:membrane-associated phospholipid phosphatase
MLLGYLAFSAAYLGSATVDLAAPRLLQPSRLDAAIPLVDWTIWIYLTQFLLLPTAIMLARDEVDRSRTFYAMLVGTALAAIIFLAWPIQIERPTQPSTGLTGLAWSMLYFTDTPRNCFPSLHVALAALAGVALWRRGYRLPAVAWPALIVMSTLTTKQHVAWDIAGGLVLAPLAWISTPRLLRYERTKPTHHAAGA